MKVLKRLFGYVPYFKGEAGFSLGMAVLVASLSFVRVGALTPVVYALFGSVEDAEELRLWPEQAAQYVPALKAPLEKLVNDYMIPRPFQTMAWALGILIALSVLKGFAQFLQQYTAGKVYTGVSRRLAADLYRHVLGLSMSFYNRLGSPSVTSRFTNDIEAVGRGTSFIFGKVLVEPLLLVGFLIMAAAISWELLLFNLILIPPLAFGIRLLGKKAKRATRKGLHSRDRLLNILQESFEGISIVKAFNMEEREEERFREENQRVRTQDLKVVKAESIARPFTEIMGIVGVALSVMMAGWLIHRGHMTTVTFTMFYAALLSISDPVRKLSNVNTRIQMLVAAGTRVFEFLDEKTDVVESRDAREAPGFSGEIRFEDVYFTYNDVDTVLRGVDLTIRKGEIAALVGPSGAGKTTIARLIPRFYDVTCGAVMLDGADVREFTLASLRAQVGLVTQEVILFNDTISANIAYGRPYASKEQIEAAARAANAHEFIEALPEKYESVIGEKGLTLSGGQRQRIALARAIIKDPPILILDEATSSLDSESEHLIQQALDEFMKGRTSIVIAHRLSTVEKASRIFVVSDGEIVAGGTNEELLKTSDIYKRLYSRQFRLAEV